MRQFSVNFSIGGMCTCAHRGCLVTNYGDNYIEKHFQEKITPLNLIILDALWFQM